MTRPFLNSFIACITGKKRATMRRNDQREEEKEQQNQMERGFIVQNRDEIDGVVMGEEEIVQHDRECLCENLPEELMIESILTRLPARTLAVCCCVSKSWYNSVRNDSRFSKVHYIQNRNKVSLVFNLLNVSRGGIMRACWFSLLEPGKADIRFFSAQINQGIYELVGFCNGLACTKIPGTPDDTRGSVTVINPNSDETLVLSYLRPTGGYIYMCHGFGFDSLSQVYKAVLMFASKTNNEILCMVITLGTMPWRTILTSLRDISPPPGSSPFPSHMVTRVSRTLCRQATFCGGRLFWRTKNRVANNSDKIQMLLSFDLHSEKIQFIRLPTECTTTTVAHERQDLVVDHLLEFKGYPCIARTERITRSNNDHYGHRCNYQTSVCCCCYKVHMYILGDKDKQVWTREETFDVQIKDQEGLLPTPLCWYSDTTGAAPPTRMLTLYDQVLLYWFNGEYLIVYNLQEKHLRVVECSRSYPSIFQTKMNEDLERRIGDDDNIFCPSMDYQLHSQVENIVSLKTFIPEGAKISKFDSADELMPLLDNNLAAGWMTTGKNKHTYYAFF